MTKSHAPQTHKRKRFPQRKKKLILMPLEESCLKRKPRCLHSGTKKSQVRNWERERLIDKYPNKHHEVKRFNIHKSKISKCKNRGPLENHRQKVKTRVGTQTWIANKKTPTTSKNSKTEHIEIFGRNWKSTATRTQNKIEETNQNYPRKKVD